MKENAAALLRRELIAKSSTPQVIGFSGGPPRHAIRRDFIVSVRGYAKGWCVKVEGIAGGQSREEGADDRAA